ACPGGTQGEFSLCQLKAHLVVRFPMVMFCPLSCVGYAGGDRVDIKTVWAGLRDDAGRRTFYIRLVDYLRAKTGYAPLPSDLQYYVVDDDDSDGGGDEIETWEFPRFAHNVRNL